MLKEFKEFAMRGNVLDLAVGIILGAAFGKIITTLVNNVLMPPIGLLLGGVDFANLFAPLDGKTYPSLTLALEAGAPVIAYGQLINDIINFLIVAFVVFMLVRWFNSLKKPVKVDAAPSTKECPYCASTIPVKATRCPDCTSQL